MFNSARNDPGVVYHLQTRFSAKVSRQFTLPIPIEDRLVLVSVSFPVLENQVPAFTPGPLTVDGKQTLPTVPITSLDLMARRALQDEMPAIMLRGFIRSTGKAVLQYQAQRAAQTQSYKGNSSTSAALDLATIALMIGSVATESADTREWRTLPGSICIARARLARGVHWVVIPTPSGNQTVEINVQGRYAFVALRMLGGALYRFPPQRQFPGGSTLPEQSRPEGPARPGPREPAPVQPPKVPLPGEVRAAPQPAAVS